MTANDVYYELRQNYDIKQIAQKLNLHIGTLKRWENLQKIPNDYLYDLNFLLGNKYEIPKAGFRSHNEFFTKKEVAKYCFDIFLNFLKIHKINAKDYTFIEPSCGDCSFYDLMPESRRIGIDLDSKNDEILCQNFLEFTPKSQDLKYAIIGNPPFGLRGNLALRFINHAKNFADFIAFILPPLFDSDGKGSPKGRVEDFSLALSEKLPLNSFIYPSGKEVEVATIFQIWVNKKLIQNKIINIEINPKKTCKKYIKVYSLSDGGTPSSTRNKAMLYKCDLYLPSTCFNSKSKPQMKIYKDFESLPHRRGYGIVILQEKQKIRKVLEQIDWKKVSFLGTNSSLNLRTSLIEEALIKKGFYDKENI
ncbi:restriction endonuclease subunit M [Helicobacter sp. 16-1353]|uniref:restriction endonuclease subunit M n=1 Tax=Helicobacter sp. 16-1353 TaxID=2004996 RepID=UPI000DCB36AC|nr:restriction endonuclease subunit M [Helicobacter sp. 16-1353]RAX51485.1 restriction endonuclease subunit M [Helicobacter sp. 16-1353]